MSRQVKLSLAVAFMALAIALPALADGVKQTHFPKADQYTLNSSPQFLIKVGENEELVTCKAKLVLQTGTAFTAERGKRRVDLQVVNWQAEGVSKLLGGPIKFRMIKNGAESPDKSYVESYELASAQGSRDFPAHAQFVVHYELETPFGIVSNLYGVTAGTIEAFPPQPGALFKMQKGDVAHLMAELMPEPLSAMSAAGEVKAVSATVEPVLCEDDPQ